MKVIVALDDSPYVDRIVDVLGKRHWPADGEFLLLHVVEQPTGWFSCMDFPSAVDTEAAHTTAEEHMLGVLSKLRTRLPEHRMSYEVVHGGVTEAIVRAAHKFGADLIVIGCQGRSNAGGLSLGGVAGYVVQHAHCSVEVIKPLMDVSTTGEINRQQLLDFSAPMEEAAIGIVVSRRSTNVGSSG